MHKEELKDTIKDLFGDGTEREFLNYITSRFPRLMVHCYNVVEMVAKDLLEEYFHFNADELAVKAIRDTSFVKQVYILYTKCLHFLTYIFRLE